MVIITIARTTMAIITARITIVRTTARTIIVTITTSTTTITTTTTAITIRIYGPIAAAVKEPLGLRSYVYVSGLRYSRPYLANLSTI